MKRITRFMLISLIFGTALPAFADLKVATALEDLASVAQFVGGNQPVQGLSGPAFRAGQTEFDEGYPKRRRLYFGGIGIGRRMASLGHSGQP